MADLSDKLSQLSPEKRLLVERLQRQRRRQAAAVEPAPPARREPFDLISAAERERLPDDVEDAYPLSMLQQGMLFHMELAAGSAVYHNVDSYHVRGELDLELLQRAVDAVVARHPMLRTSFDLSSFREPLQLVHRTAELLVGSADLRGLPAAAQQEAIDAYIDEQRRTPFDLPRPPLLRFMVHRRSANTFQFSLTEHHAIFDGWSLQSTHAEIFDLHAALRRGEPLPAEEPLPLGYRDFVALERQALESEACQRYWEHKLADRTSMRLPRAAASSTAVSSTATGGARRVRTVCSPFSTPEFEGLKRVAETAGVPLKSVLLAAHLKVMSMLGGTGDVLTGMVTNGRPEEVGGERIRGLFLNTLPLRAALPGGTWTDLVLLAFQAEAELLPFRRYPLVALQKRWGGGEPLFEAAFTYAHFHVLDSVFGSGELEWLVEGSRIAEETNFTLSAFFQQYTHPARLELAISCDLAELGEEQAEAIGAYYLEVVRAMIADSGARYDGASFLPAGEERWLLAGGATEPAPAEISPEVSSEIGSELCLHAGFERQVARDPRATALSCDGATLSYGELNERANRLAHRLLELGVGPDVPVGIHAERSLAMVVAILAVLKAGGAYVPLDPAQPEERLAFILEDVFQGVRQPVLLAADEAALDGLTGGLAHPPTVVPLAAEAHAGRSAANPAAGASADNLAYVIYTSGSTGKPKGSLVTHRNVARLFAATARWFAFDERDVWTLFHSYAFDFSVWELWGALLYGGRLVVVPYWVSRSPADFLALLAAEGVTVLNQTPSAFRQLVAAEGEAAAGGAPPTLALRSVVFGGEALDLPSLGPWFERHGDQHPLLVNMYGITETTVHVTYRALRQSDAGGRDGSPIGAAIPDLRIHALDPHGNLAPAGVPGEMYVGGAGLARGYLRRPDLTAERFVPDPFAAAPGLRLYRSGDLARRRRDGELEFLGRTDHQVKVRGFRIELGEIEAALAGHPQVREVVVVARQDRDVQRLVAYVVLRAGEEVAAGVLRSRARAWLPEYMVPAVFVVLEAMPLTPNGKLDRRALPAPDPAAQAEREHEPPETPAEIALAEVWEEVLGVERVGRQDDYFVLGGDSILSLRVLARARNAGYELTLPELFEHQVLHDLARFAAARGGRAPAAETAPFSLLPAADRALLPAGLDDAYPLARLQGGMLFASSAQPESAVYHDVFSAHVRAEFDAGLLRRALERLVALHPILRTSFDLATYGEPLQLVHPAVAVDLAVEDIRHLEPPAQEELLAAWMEAEKRRPIDLARAPLIRFHLHRRGEATFQFSQSFHHAILDGWSEAAFLTQLFRVYRALLRGEEAAADGGPLSSYRRFVALERQALRSEEDREHWSRQLAEAPFSALPRWRRGPAPGRRANGKGVYKGPLTPALSADLRRFAHAAGVPLKSVLLAVHCRVLALLAGQDEVVTGMVVNGRPEEAGGERVLGLFLNTVPFRLDLTGGSWSELAARTFAAERALLPHRRVPLGELQARAGGRTLFEAVFGYIHFHAYGAFVGVEDVEALATDFFEETSLDFSVNFGRDPFTSQITVQVEFDLDKFAPEQVRAIVDRYAAAFAALAAAPSARYEDDPLLTAAETHQLAAEWNDTAVETMSGECFHRLFELQAARAPEAIAVRCGAGALRYAELDRRANRLARRLAALGCGPEVRVGVALERSLELPVALLAVLKAGGAYVPLDPGYPAERLSLLVADSGAAMLLTQERLRGRLPAGLPTLCLEAGWRGEPEESGEELALATELATDPRQLAYVIYTSGSTGRPKGVLVTHQGLSNYLAWAAAAYEMAAGEGALVHSPLASDLTVTSLLLPLAAGRTVRLLPEGIAGEALAEALLASEVGEVGEGRASVLKLTPAHLQLIGQALGSLTGSHGPAGRPRFLVVGGEALSAESLAPWRAEAPETRVINEYGPTETVVGCCVYEARPEGIAAGPVPIGRPIANTRLDVLDRHLTRVAAGVTGELFIGGAGVARGYLDRPELTAWRFVPSPWGGVGERLYRTGDLARHLPDGNLEFLGRTDHQVKIRGYRIEVGEVEAALLAHPAVAECAVVAREEGPVRQLVAYLAFRPAAEPPVVAELRAHLEARLPEPMIPARFVTLERLPLTAAGKVDRAALPAVGQSQAVAERPYVAPRTPEETALAEIWAAALGRERVSVEDNFFELGGDSISGILVVARGKAKGFVFSAQDVFQQRTIAALAATLRRSEAGAPASARPAAFSLISPEDRERLDDDVRDAFPLGALQAGMLFHMELDPESAVYHSLSSFHLRARLEPSLLRTALGQLIVRHAVLRTSFHPTGFREPLQAVHRQAEPRLAVEDLRHLAPAEQESALAAFLAAEGRAGFDWGSAPLLRVIVHRRSDDSFQLTLSYPHAILDGWSVATLLAELFQLYLAYLAGRPSPLGPRPATTYREFVALERAALASPESRRYWATALEGATYARLDRWGRSGETARKARMTEVPVPPAVSAGLRQAARDAGMPLKSVLLAVHSLVLSTLTGGGDVVTGLVVDGRPETVDAERILGLFLNTLPLRLPISGARFCDLIQAAFDAEQRMLPFRRHPLVDLQSASGGQPLFEVAFNYVHFHVLQSVLGAEGVEILDAGEALGSTNLPLFVEFSSALDSEAVRLHLQHDPAELADEQMALVAGYYSRALAALAASAAEPTAPLAGFSLLSAAERTELTRAWNDTAAPYPADVPVHELIARQAHRTPEAPALLAGAESLTYAELAARSGRLAGRLRRLGAGAESLVGLFLERSAEMVVALLGTLESGAAYVPLDPSHPEERLAAILADARPAVLLTEEKLAGRLAALASSAGLGGVALLSLDGPEGEGADPVAVPPPWAAPEQRAYVIFTSGSTGRPKGVQIAHRALANFLSAMARRPGLAAGDVLVAVTTLSFDIAALELLLPLTVGARVVLADQETVADGERLAALLLSARASALQATPATWRMLLAAGWRGDGRLKALCGGEALPRDLAAALLVRVGELWNVYGPTETTVWSAARRVTAGESPVRFGAPIDNTELYLLDGRLGLVPRGVAGELSIGGAGLARGYLDQPGLTAERFVPDPFAAAPGSRLYRTGDLARALPEGELEFLGRIDGQVKLRGFRIELGEIEAALAAHPGVRQAVVVLREVEGNPRLVAYVVAAGESAPEPAELRRWALARLPDYMVPAAWVSLPDVPLTPSGKVDRKALPAPQSDGESAVFVAPRTPVEEVLAGIWSRVLGVEAVSAAADFFELGGHSLLAAQVAARVRQAFGVEMPLRRLFEAPTVALLAREVETAMRATDGLAQPPLEALPRSGRDLPLSFAQQRLWLLDRLAPDNPAYNIPLAVRLAGPLQVPALADALCEVVRRHEVLRTTFPAVDGEPVQRIAAPGGFPLPAVDLAALPAARREDEVRRLAVAEAGRPFELARGPLARATLLRGGAADHALLLAMHHIVSDGWSMGLLTREVAALYEVLAASRPPAVLEPGEPVEALAELADLPELPVQYADFAHWQRRWLQGEALETLLGYWRRRLDGAPPVVELPTDRPRPAVQSFRGAARRGTLPAALAAELQRLGREEGATLFMLLLAGFEALLSRYARQPDLLVGTPIAGRSHVEVESLIGFFVNTLVQRADLAGEPGLRELVRRVRDTALEGHVHQDVPFEKLVDELAVERSLSYTPLFQVTFDFQSTGESELAAGGVRMTPLDVHGGTAKFDLSLLVAPAAGGPGGLALAVEYAADLFDATTVDRMLRHLGVLLAAAVADPERRLDLLPLLAAGEREQIVREWNDYAKDCPQVPLVHELFAAHARRRPQATAVASDGARLTYGDLDRRANRLAHHLRGLGVGPETLVAVCTERTLERVVGIVGILKAGAAYVSLDPTYPEERLSFLLADAEAPVLLTQAAFADRLPASAARVIRLDADWDQIVGREDAPPATGVNPESLAYVVYTSGSTGKPKGVEIPHAGLMNLVRWHQDLYSVGPDDRGTQIASPAFDASIWELWPYLAAGASVHIPDEETRLSSPGMLRWWSRVGITLAYLMTPLAEGVLEEPIPDLPLQVRALIIGGDRLHNRPSPEAGFRLMNHYGPAEYTVTSTVVRVPPAGEGDGIPTIGRPIDNTQIYILDRELGPVPIGVPGELFVAGVGIARGYLRRPDMTAEKFIPDPFSEEPGARMYRTADLVRYLPDGDMDFLGRLDHQVKLRGLRIELGEIESVLGQHPELREVAVLVREDRPGAKRLVAYLVPAAAGEPPAVEALRAFLASRLPEYMVPRTFVFLDALPLTPNGKVDRRRLPQPEAEVDRDFAPPRTATERVVAAVWAEVLKLERVGIADDFFDLGGHSLLGTQVTARLETIFQVSVPLRALFESPTVEGLAAALVELAGGAEIGDEIARTYEELQALSDDQVRNLLLEPS